MMAKPVPPVSATTATMLREAAARLLDGKPTKSRSHDLTAINLAREAGVSRATMNRAESIRDQFLADVAALRSASEASHPVVRLERARADAEETRQKTIDELRFLRTMNEQLANQVQVLSARVTQLDEALRRRTTPSPDDDPTVRNIASARRPVADS